jgi:S-adenosylmethionine:tRNA ribosyltransferase-isomerase
MRLEDFDYPFDESLIAQHPIEPRDRARLLVVDRRTDALAHHRFDELPTLLRPNDLLVLNDTQVIPARLPGRKRPSGGKVEVLLVRQGEEANRWHALVRGHMRSGQQVELPHGVLVGVTTAGEGGHALITFPSGLDVLAYAEKAGQVPLPPYLHRAPVDEDRARYQTVFARRPGAVAAPTAGLHFTPEILDRCRSACAEIARVTLHVGLGTFQPLHTEILEDVKLHSESFTVPQETVRAMDASARVVAVGTTSVRAIESDPAKSETDLFISPGFAFRRTGALLTNFHLPRSSLLVLVSTFAGRELTLAAYRHAVEQKYRFFSYGDCMLIV